MRSPAIDKETVSNMLTSARKATPTRRSPLNSTSPPPLSSTTSANNPSASRARSASLRPQNPSLRACNLNIDRRIVTLSGVFLSFEMDTEDDSCRIFTKSDEDGMKFRATVPRALLEALGNEILEAAKF